MDTSLKSSRRKFLTAAAGTLVIMGIRNPGWAEERNPTPQCSHAGEVTPQETAGPYFKPNSPERSLLVESGEATQLTLLGRVMTTSCKPIPRALLEFWHADAEGLYDLKEFRHRGHLFSDEAGRFEVQTILPSFACCAGKHPLVAMRHGPPSPKFSMPDAMPTNILGQVTAWYSVQGHHGRKFDGRNQESNGKHNPENHKERSDDPPGEEGIAFEVASLMPPVIFSQIVEH